MAPEAVQPLRITKGISPGKMGTPGAARPLSEIGPMERRRNSPSFNQATKKPFTSPFDSSPVSGVARPYWSGQDASSPTRSDSENIPFREPTTSPSRRMSLEKLQQASRVSNSNMFAREHNQKYDPTIAPSIERPLASRHHFGGQLQSHAYTAFDADPNKAYSQKGHRRSESNVNSSQYKASQATQPLRKSVSPSREQPSPSKSSLSSNSRYVPTSFDAEAGQWSDDNDTEIDGRAATPRAMLRHAKSVTFDAAPPQVNEYEMATPDPSSIASGSREGSYDSEAYEGEGNFERESSFEEEDSFDASLEDTHKTPVVLPEDWRFMSPEASRSTLSNTFEDPFKAQERSPSPSAQPNRSGKASTADVRSGSLDSNGNPRPLPPLPSTMATDLYSKSQRSLPSPPRPATISKADILRMSDSPMPLDERLRLLSVQEQSNALRQSLDADGGKIATLSISRDSNHAPQISRESVLHTVNQSVRDAETQSAVEQTLNKNAGEIDYSNLDPDVPIPSRETSSSYEEGEEAGFAFGASDTADPETSINQRESSVIRYQVDDDEDDSSSVVRAYEDEDCSSLFDAPELEDLATPKAKTSDAIIVTSNNAAETHRMSLPELSFADEDFGFHLRSYTSPSPPPVTEIRTREVTAEPEFSPPSTEIASPDTPAEAVVEETADAEEESIPATPESVICRSTVPQPLVEAEAPVVPEPMATIKAPGSKLKTRPSVTPADLEAMAATRRQVSGEVIPEDSADVPLDEMTEAAVDAMIERNRSLRMQLEVPVGESATGFGLSLDEEFDRLLEAKKRGYMMRQNTKVIVASNRQASDEKKVNEKATTETGSTNSPRKTSAQTWTTEPWNGKMRRQSIRRPPSSTDKKFGSGPAPPLPGSESNVAQSELSTSDLGYVDEETGERGRLFVKVVGVKELDLPLPKQEKSWFQLTLDNGLHCVTTTYLELGKTAPIGQEFELIVFDDLEFQLTLQTKLERPTSQASNSEFGTKAAPKAQKNAGFSRLFTSPKKRREQEKKQQEEDALAEQQRVQALEAAVQPTAWDLLHKLVASDGSFARAYVNSKNHEREAFGRPITVDVPCWNEWATEETPAGNSTRSKLGGIQRKPPYKIGKLELQLLYVPKPKGVKDEDMPKSMSACIRELKEAENNINRRFEGHLSQQGGDCPYWRRRFFKLDGSKLTAYHEATRQPRATINLTKATKLIDDKSMLTQSNGMTKTTSRGGRSRRKSAFAEDEEGYMFIEEGFRIRFANGEVIDFYADSISQKDEWMKVLAEVVGRDVAGEKTSWTSAILAHERLERARKISSREAKAPTIGPRGGSKSVPSSPVKRPAATSAATNAMLPPPSPSKESLPRANVAKKATTSSLQPPTPIDKSPRHSLAAASPTKAAKASPTKQASPTKTKLPKAPPPPPKANTFAKDDAPAPVPRDKKPNARRGLVRSMIF